MPIGAQPATTIVEQTIAEFRRDWERLSSSDQRRVRDALNVSYARLREDQPGFFTKVAYQPMRIQLKGGLGSSLYALRVGRDIR